MIQSRIFANDWPPREVREQWEKVALLRARFENDRAKLIQLNPYWHSEYRRGIYTPVPMAREIAKLSAGLLFSVAPKITLEGLQDELDELLDANESDAFFHSCGERVASEGRGALRIIRDEEVIDEPIICYTHDDQVIWDVKHGKIVSGGVVVVERTVRERTTPETFRLLEEHTPGLVSRRLYKGRGTQLGERVELDRFPEFAGLEEEEETGLDVPTLVRWENVPGGDSDVAAHEALLDRLDEAESSLVDKARKSTPRIFADSSLADQNGRVEDSGVILTGGKSNLMPELGEQRALPIELLQPQFASEDHVRWVEHVREMLLTTAGYSLATYGLDDGGTADSGTALKLRQMRTLLTLAGKTKMAQSAIAQAVAVAMALKSGASEVQPYRPVVTLGNGLPEDSAETAQELSTLKSAQLISAKEALRRLYPDRSDEDIDQEIALISQQSPQPDLSTIFGAPPVATG